MITIFTGCIKQNTSGINKKITSTNYYFLSDNTYENVDKAVNDLANQLLVNIKNSTRKNYKIILTSFVNLDNFSQTSTIGRVLSEALIDELHIRRFHILDYRTQELIIVNKDGEFSLTRDAKRLSDEVPESLVLVGTYTLISSNKILINTRILNTATFDVVSTAKVNLAIKDCKLLNNCPKNVKPIINFIPIQEDK